MSLQVLDRLGWADAMTLLNAGIGVLALAAAVLGEVRLVAQLILLAAVADGLDGVIARNLGSTEVGPYLDSISDIVSFGTTPALFVFVLAYEEWQGGLTVSDDPELLALAGVVAAIFVVFSIVRTALYTVYVGEDEHRPRERAVDGDLVLSTDVVAPHHWEPTPTLCWPCLGIPMPSTTIAASGP